MKKIPDDFNHPCILPATSRITFSDHLDHFLARWGFNRSGHAVKTGVYSLGNPTPDSPVFVTANYTLSFDALRSALNHVDAYILILDTKSINVWCASGKGSFGTDELIHRIESTGLKDIVSHRVLILPQLGSPGVSAHQVKKESGFKVEFGPVRAEDLPKYLKDHKATPDMRKVQFTLRDRLILIPVELTHAILPVLILGTISYFIDGFLATWSIITVALTGIALYPILLPWIPTPNFSTKGFLLGTIAALPFVLITLLGNPDVSFWIRAGKALAYLLAMPAVTAFLTLNFTGSTTYTSRSGVKSEIYTYVPRMAWMMGGSVVFILGLSLIRILGGSG